MLTLSYIKFILICAIGIFTINASAQVNVWPGDANNSGNVNHFDLLYFGLGYSYQGPPRLQKSVLFQSQSTINWNLNLPDSTNFAFLDCNGSGHISLDDTIAIRLNYGNAHTSATNTDLLSPIQQNGAPLMLELDSDSVLNYNEVSFSINLGELSNPVDSFYGLAFSLNYDPQRIQAGSFSAQLDSAAWVNKSGSLTDQALMMYFEESSAGKLNIAISKTNLTNAAGQGRILIVNCVIEDNLIGKGFQAMELSISDVLLIGNDLNPKPIKTNSKDLSILPTSIGEPKNEAAFSVKIYPNPAENILNVQTKDPSQLRLSIFDIQGNRLEEISILKSNTHQINISDLPKGIYFLQIANDENAVIKKFIKL